MGISMGLGSPRKDFQYVTACAKVGAWLYEIMMHTSIYYATIKLNGAHFLLEFPPQPPKRWGLVCGRFKHA